MNPIVKTGKNQRGQALLTAMIFLLALTFLGFGLITIATIDMHSARNLRLAQEALTAAEEGALMGLAYASQESTGFMFMAEGATVKFDSISEGVATATDRRHYQVELLMGDETDCPPGTSGVGRSAGAGGVRCVLMTALSTGMVSERPGFAVNLTAGSEKRPQIRRTVEIVARMVVPRTGY